MSIQKPRRIDRRTAENLLAGAPMGAHEGHPPLAALLTAAAAPGRPDELAREQATMAAFRSAQLAPVSRPHRLSAVKSAAMRVLTVKAAVALAATTAGGVAVAAGAGRLPIPLVPRAPVISSGLSAAQPTPTQSPAASIASDNARPAAPRASKSPDSSHAPAPSLTGLCQAYFADYLAGSFPGNKTRNDSNSNNDNNSSNRTPNDRTMSSKSANDKAANDKAKNDKLLDNPAYSALVTAAGGKDKVGRFCLSLLVTATPSSSAGQHGIRPDDNRRAGQRDRTRDDSHTNGSQQFN